MAARQLASATILGAAGLAAQGAARFAHTTWVGNTAPERLGSLSALLSVSVFLTLFGPAAVGIAAGRFAPRGAARAREYLHTLSRQMRWLSVLLAVGAFAVAWTLGGLVESVLCVVLVVTYGWYLYARGALIGSGQVRRAALLDIGTALLTLAAVAVVVTGRFWDYLLLPPAIGYALFALIGRPRTAPTGVTPGQVGLVRSFLVTNTIAQVATGALIPLMMLCVQWFDAANSSAFGAALALATPPNMIAQALLLVLVPHFATIAGAHGGRVPRGQILPLLAASGVFWVALFGLLVALGPILLDVIYPGRFPESAPTLRILLVIMGVASFAMTPVAVLVGSGQERRQAAAALAGLVAGVAVLAVAAPVWKSAGAVAGFAVGIAVTSALVLYQSLRRSPEPVLEDASPDR